MCVSHGICGHSPAKKIKMPTLQLWQESRAISHGNKMIVSQRRALEVILDVQLDPYYSQAAHMLPGYDIHKYCTCKYEEPGVLSHDTLRHSTVTGKSNNKCLRTYAVRYLTVSLGTSRNCTMDNLNTNSSLCIRIVTILRAVYKQ